LSLSIDKYRQRALKSIKITIIAFMNKYQKFDSPGRPFFSKTPATILVVAIEHSGVEGAPFLKTNERFFSEYSRK